MLPWWCVSGWWPSVTPISGIRRAPSLRGRPYRRDARDVRLERDQHHVGHQPEVVGEFDRARRTACRFPGRASCPRARRARTCCSISRTDVRYSSILRRSAAAERRTRDVRSRRSRRRGCSGASHSRRARAAGGSAVSAPNSRSNRLRGSEIGRQWLCLRLPRQVVGVGAGVTAVAVARLTRFLEADFERRQPRDVADRLRRQSDRPRPRA